MTTDNEQLPEALRWQLRSLRRDEAPARDLWSGIATQVAMPAQATRRISAPRGRHLALAAAASLVLLVGAFGWWQGAQAPVAAATDALVQREADGLTLEYQAALQELAPVPQPVALQATFDLLDRDAALIREALVRDPDSRLLLEQLRRTYAHRLELVQRAAYG